MCYQPDSGQDARVSHGDGYGCRGGNGSTQEGKTAGASEAGDRKQQDDRTDPTSSGSIVKEDGTGCKASAGSA